MRLRIVLVAWVALAAGAAGASGGGTDPGASASVFATVGHSEWCPPGTVRLDLGTGRYTLRAPPSWRTCRRPAFRSRIGTDVLGPGELATIRIAFRRVEAEGLEHPDCRNGGRPERIIISNGGRPTLRLTRRGRMRAPPNDRNCWSDAARGLHRVVESVFEPRIGHGR